MMKRSEALTVMAAVVVLFGGCASGAGETAASEPPTQAASSALASPVVKLSEQADLYEVEVPEGWELVRSTRPGVANFTARKLDGQFPPTSVDLEHWGEDWAQESYGDEQGGVSQLSLENVLKHYQSIYSTTEFTEVTVLPEREIGGEQAVGLKLRPPAAGASADLEQFEELRWEQWYVVRHDGVWRFVISSGLEQDQADEEAQAILSSFRWVGPAEPTPSASES
ncbi:MAG: hypothetical protein Q4D96_14285 [Propionibacteriaceae bacterium]|nr:hypothetical protein [Propionibacteriaceae bacterium]